MNTYQKALSLLTPHEKRRGVLVLLLVVVMALMETAGVASILPFLAVLGNPEVVHTNPILSTLYTRLEFQSIDRFLMVMGIAAFAVVILGAGVRILTTYAMNVFAQMRGHSLAERLLETYLRQPYVFFLNRHSSDLAKGILSEVYQVVTGVLQPGFYLIAYSIVALALIVLLILVDPWLALVVGLVIGGLYAIVFLSIKGLLGRLGTDRVAANQERFTAAGEALGGIKDIKLLGRESVYLSRFRPSSMRFARHQAINAVLSETPKYLIEAVAIGGTLILALFLMSTDDSVGSVLPVLGLYAFTGYKLLPAAQRIYTGLAQLRFGAAALNSVYEDLQHRTALAEIHTTAPATLVPKQEIVLDGLCFTYPQATKSALEAISLTIPVGHSVGLVGGTGAGKTTLVDLILGLLRPTEGMLMVDGVPITEANLRAWQQALGYVPQVIFLTDTTVAENIALGVPRAAIDMGRVQDCARMAQIHEFVMSEMPNQYQTLVGERGVRLSGGQRQRIGIARALYHNPAVLVFDEATSALDTMTERAVMDAVHALSHQKTIILIAHRLSTVRACDQIFMLDHGRLVDKGSYEELLVQSSLFQEMV